MNKVIPKENWPQSVVCMHQLLLVYLEQIKSSES